MRKLRSSTCVWNTYDMHSMSWAQPMDMVMEVHGGVWATLMEPVVVGRDDYPDHRDLAEALQDAFRINPREAMMVSEDVFQFSALGCATVIQVQIERPGGGVDEVLLPALPSRWAEKEQSSMMRSLEISLGAAQECEIEGSYAERTALPGYAL